MWNNTDSNPENPLASNEILKKAERRISCVVSDQPLNSCKCFLLVAISHMNDTVSICIYKELQSCSHLSSSLLLPWKCKYKTREPYGLRCELYAVFLYRVLWELGTIPPFFYYELLTFINHECWSQAGLCLISWNCFSLRCRCVCVRACVYVHPWGYCLLETDS